MFKKLFFIILFFIAANISIFPQNNQQESSITKKILDVAHANFDSLVTIRRDLHQYPELAGNEINTSKKIRDYLTKLGLEVKPEIGGHGVVAILKGNKPGPTIAWRADIDAFKDNSPDNVSFASKISGVRHICGHDIHTTIALGIAKVLSSLKDEISGTIVFIFQPAEETFSGAYKMIDDGIFNEIKPEAIFGLHVSPLPTGTISVKEKEMYPASKEISITLDGKNNLDSAADECITILQSFNNVKDEKKFFDISTLGDPELGVISPKSIYANYVAVMNPRKEKLENGIVVKARILVSSEENHKAVMNQLEEKLKGAQWKDYVKSISVVQKHENVFNDPKLTASAVNIIKDGFGERVLIPLYGMNPFNNDDFAVFQRQVPGVYFFIGASDFSKGIIAMPHTPTFTADENCIEKGVSYFSFLLQQYSSTK